MSTERAERYVTSATEDLLLARIIATHSGKDPSAIRSAIAEAWMWQHGRPAGPDQYDWFDYVAVHVAKLPTEAQQMTRAEIMKHAESTKHSIQVTTVTDDCITVVCRSCGLIIGPWTPGQAQ